MQFPKVYIFGAPIELAGPSMVSSKFVKIPSSAKAPSTKSTKKYFFKYQK